MFLIIPLALRKHINIEDKSGEHRNIEDCPVFLTFHHTKRET